MENQFEPQFNNQPIVHDDADTSPQEKDGCVYEQPGVRTISAGSRSAGYVPYGLTPETYSEKKKIKRAAWMVGISFLIMWAVSEYWAYPYYYIMSLLGYSQRQASIVLSDPGNMQIFQIYLSVLFFTVPFVVVFKCFGERISGLISFGRPKKKTALPFFLFGIAFCSFANIAVSQASYFFEQIGVNYEVNYPRDPTGIFGFLLSFLSTAIAPALVEEFACRGLVLGKLRKYGDGFAVVASSVLFACMHGNFDQIPFTFLVGLALGYIVVKTGTIWVAVAVHSYNNFVSVFFSYFMKNAEQSVQNCFYSVLLTVCILAGIAAVRLLAGKDNDFHKFNRSPTVCTVNQKIQWFYTSPVIIVFIAVCLWDSMKYFVN